MPFFSLTDIKIKEPENSVRQGSFLPSPYESSVFRYPLDIGSLDKGHYMVIHINQQVKTQFRSQTAEYLDLPTIIENQTRLGTGQTINTLGPDFEKIGTDVSQSNIVNLGSDLWNRTTSLNIENQTIKDLAQTAGSAKDYAAAQAEGAIQYIKDAAKQMAEGRGLRTIERTTDTIALYMPDTLSFTQNQSYSSMELGGGLFATLGAAAAGYSYLSGMSDKTQVADKILKNLTPFIASKVLDSFGNAGRAVFAASTGTVVNPQLELIYTSPSFREFRFDFMLYPRSAREAAEVQSILTRLKFHQSPEILKEGSAGGLGAFFLIPPSEFDIKFYYNGRINPNIPAISTCVLTSIDTDYAPNGWSAYEVPKDKGTPVLGSTGMPVGIKLSLVFQETELITKNNAEAQTQGFADQPPSIYS